MERGMITDQIKEKYNMSPVELRLIPYVQYLLVNQMAVDPLKISSEERNALINWRNKGYLTFSMRMPLTVSKQFWDLMNEFLWDCYVIHLEADKEG